MFDWGVLPSKSYPLPVICVGNLAVGGTGKTPHVEYLLRLLNDNGYHVAMLSRGYGRKTKGFVLADAQRHSAADIGDEPYQMMLNCPFATVAVCEKRVEGIDKLLVIHPETDVIVLDDAYQHRYVKAGLNILLTDAHRLYTNDHLLPWGRLREPAFAAKRAQLLVVTKCNGEERPLLRVGADQLLYYSRIVYAEPVKYETGEPVQTALHGKQCLLIAGIANPKPLVAQLESQGLRVTLVQFPDHHAFTKSDAEHINRMWQQHHCDLAFTTQKDSARLRFIRSNLKKDLVVNLLVQPITVRIGSNKKELSFNNTILQYVRANKRNCRMD